MVERKKLMPHYAQHGVDLTGKDRSFSVTSTPADMIPQRPEVVRALENLVECLDKEEQKALNLQPGELELLSRPLVEKIARKGWNVLLYNKVPERWPNFDGVPFPPATRAKLLRALAVLDLWCFTPRGVFQHPLNP